MADFSERLQSLVEQRDFDETEIPKTPVEFPEALGARLGMEDTRPEGEGAEEEILEPFELPDGLVHERFVTRGGMAEIHFVRDEWLKRTVAMKLIRADRADRDEALVRFVDEAQITAQLNHPGVPPVHRFGELADGRPYFTMKALGETTLDDVLYRAHSVTEWQVDEVLEILLRVCETVDYAHRCGVIQGDLKPKNIMVGPCGEVRVIDWGLARHLDRPPDDDRQPSPQSVDTDRQGEVDLTMDGSIVGTAAYMAPEQVRGRQDRVGRASDVFSLGAILYEILAGEPAFSGEARLEVMLRVLDGLETPASELEGVPEELGRVCDRALDPYHGNRFSDAGALREELDAHI